MAKLADALDLGSSGQPWGFESLRPDQKSTLKAHKMGFYYDILSKSVQNFRKKHEFYFPLTNRFIDDLPYIKNGKAHFSTIVVVDLIITNHIEKRTEIC